MVQLTNRERGILVVLIMICGIYAGYAFVYRPSVVERQRIEENIRHARRKLNEQMKLIRKERLMPVELRESIGAMRQLIAPEEVMSVILSEIETAARGLKIRINEMKPQGIITDDVINRFPVSLAVDGSFKELMAFVHLLQAPEHDLKVTQFHLEKGFSDPGTLLAKIVVVRMLIRPEVDPVKGAGTKNIDQGEYEPS